MRKNTLALALFTLLIACDAPTEPPSLAPQSSEARASGAGTETDAGAWDANGNGVVCVKAVPASGRASDRASNRAEERSIAMDDDGTGLCPGGFDPLTLGRSTLAAGPGHACVLDAAGAAWCWGDNRAGALGAATADDYSLIPVQVQDAPALTSITAGNHFTCGLDDAGAAWCWGSNANGVLGIGDVSVASSHVPMAVAGGRTFTSLDAGERFACAIDETKQLYCWGSNRSGALGTTTAETCRGAPCASAPIASAGALRFTSVDGGLMNACGVATDGNTYCWGWDDHHQGGDGIASTGPTPQAVATPPYLVDVDAGTVGACGLDSAGDAYCWSGWFLAYGWLGTGSYDRSSTPVPVTGGHTFRTIESADANNIFWFNCGIEDGGEALCWGSNFYGQLGTEQALDSCGLFYGTPHSCSATPLAVAGGHSWQELDLGLGYACGRSTADEIYCWGNNANGTLGDGTTTSRPLPAPVTWNGSASGAETNAIAADAGATAIDTSAGDTRVLKD